MFKGIYTAIVTPFTSSGELDLSSFAKLIKNQINAKISGIIISGSTGEASSLSEKEYKELLELGISLCKDKVQVIAGCSSNNTDHAINLAKIAEECNVDGIMIVVPFYNKPSQSGIYNHFKKIHDSTNTSIILYSVPGRTVVDFTDETLIKLSKLERVRALKDASGDLERVLRVKQELDRNEVTLLCGDDISFLAFCANGGEGLISVASNIIPDQLEKIWQYIVNNNYKNARGVHMKFINLYRNLFIESNPVPIKFALSQKIDTMSPYVRLPLAELEEKSKVVLRELIKTLSI